MADGKSRKKKQRKQDKKTDVVQTPKAEPPVEPSPDVSEWQKATTVCQVLCLLELHAVRALRQIEACEFLCPVFKGRIRDQFNEARSEAKSELERLGQKHPALPDFTSVEVTEWGK